MKEYKKQIGLIGYGSVGKQLYNTLLENGYRKEQIFIFADDIEKEHNVNSYGFTDFKKSEFHHLHFIPTLGYLSKNIKYDILNFLLENSYNLFSFIHPSSFVSRNANIGKGVIIYPLCNIDQGVYVGDGSIILNSSIIAHDSIIGKCSYLAPGVCLSGNVLLNDLCFLGTGTTVSNNIEIGRNSTIAIGSCITHDLPENSYAIGNPCKLIQNLELK